MPCRATQDGWVMVESSDKMWSTGEGNSKPLWYSCPEKPMNSQFSFSVVSDSVQEAVIKTIPKKKKCKKAKWLSEEALQITKKRC